MENNFLFNFFFFFYILKNIFFKNPNATKNAQNVNRMDNALIAA
jgi:hypothetical protein